MTGKTTPKAPRIADVLAELVAELRLANRLRVLSLGAAAIEHDSGARTGTTGPARERLDRRNALRAEVRQSLGLDDEEIDRG